MFYLTNALTTELYLAPYFNYGCLVTGTDQLTPSWCGPTELFLVPASAPRLVQQRLWYVILSVG